MKINKYIYLPGFSFFFLFTIFINHQEGNNKCDIILYALSLANCVSNYNLKKVRYSYKTGNH